MDFGQLNNLIYLLLIPIIIFIFYLGIKKRKKILKKINITVEENKNNIRFILIAGGIFLIALSLIEPKIYKGMKKIDKKALDIYVLIDVSKSMDVEDIKPTRLERVKMDINQLIDSLKGDRIGFIPFSSDSYIQMPITDDYDVAKIFLESIDTDMIGAGGTNITKAVYFAKESFDKNAVGEKVIIIMSDGEDHNEQMKIDLDKIKYIKIYSIGFGTENGGLVPYNNESGVRAGYKQDESGKFVVSKLNSDFLKEIAKKGNGKYYDSTISGIESKRIIEDMEMLRRNNIKTEHVKDYYHIFQYVLGVGILMFIIGYFYRRRNK